MEAQKTIQELAQIAADRNRDSSERILALKELVKNADPKQKINVEVSRIIMGNIAIKVHSVIELVRTLAIRNSEDPQVKKAAKSYLKAME